MDDSMKTGLMAILAVSGSVVLVAMHAHNRLISNFIKEMEFHHQIKYSTGTVKDEAKKKVRFADDDVAEKAYYKKKHMLRRTSMATGTSRNYNGDKNLDAMPQNWQVMYKGILQQRNINIRGNYK